LEESDISCRYKWAISSVYTVFKDISDQLEHFNNINVNKV
jgi:hypothetical protein